MLTYETIKKLCKEKGVTVTGVEKELGFARGSLCKINTNKPSIEKAQKIADYFEVSIERLMGVEETETKETALTPKDERDIAKDVDRIMEKLSLGEDGPASYNGEILSEESMELFKEELQIALKRLKLINKERYNPHKNKK